jgi:transcriptional regulator of arginine metabolism
MSNRNERLDVIKRIITQQELCSQEELLQALSAEGFNLTQATLSRDLKQLKVAKTANHEGRYIYAMPGVHQHRTAEHRQALSFLGDALLSIDFSGNIAVIKTAPGYASSMAYNIDNQSNRDILGTIAGDDTIMMVLREGVARQDISDYLADLFASRR